MVCDAICPSMCVFIKAFETGRYIIFIGATVHITRASACGTVVNTSCKGDLVDETNRFFFLTCPDSDRARKWHTTSCMHYKCSNNINKLMHVKLTTAVQDGSNLLRVLQLHYNVDCGIASFSKYVCQTSLENGSIFIRELLMHAMP